MRNRTAIVFAFPVIFLGLLVLHAPFLRLPYFWDEAGYYVPAALDFFHRGLLIPRSTLPTGHTPCVTVYLGTLWRLFGFSTLTTRVAMILISAAAVLTTCVLGRRVAGREAGCWSALLLALSPLFFAQSSLVFLDLTAAWFTTLAILLVLEERWWMFALAASLAVMSKETAVAMLPVIWAFALFRRKERRAWTWVALLTPLLPLAAWVIYYHHATGFWTGNREYLQYNLYSTLAPIRICRALLARLGEVFIQGFNWLIVAAALAGFAGRGRRLPRKQPERIGRGDAPLEDFVFLATGLIAAYILMLSLVGGAVLPRYMLPVFPVFYVVAVRFIWSLPQAAARCICVMAAACFVGAWFINPPYPFPYEDNVSYADFIRLHQNAARFLEVLPGNPVILTAWPATAELTQPFLGYVNHPLRVATLEDFAPADFREIPRFDVLYLYSRKWQPVHDALTQFHSLRAFLERFYNVQPQISPVDVALRFHLRLVWRFERRGQWTWIYVHLGATGHEEDGGEKHPAALPRGGREGPYKARWPCLP